MKNAQSAFTIWFSGVVLLILMHCALLSTAQQLPAIVRDWAAYAGQTDSVFKTPVVLDEDSNLYVGTFRVDSVTGADVLIVKYGTDGGVKWEVSWSGAGLGRDQVSDLAYYNGAVYVSGITQGSASNNYDMLFMRVSSEGIVEWVNTWNGPASSFDVGTAVLADNGGVFVTGASSDSATAMGYRTFSLEPSSGTILWERSYDFAGLNDVPFDLGREGTTLVVTGGSQSTLSNWDYATVFYDDSGTQLSVNRVTGTSSGFDRAQAVKMDVLGNVYITGGSYENGVGQEVKTVKIAPTGNVIWVKTYGGSSDDTGNDLVVDANGNVYVCGQTYDATNGFDLVLIKYSSGGTQLWKQIIDVEKKDDAAVSLCLDAWGHVVVTGYATRDNQFDMLTIGYNENGNELWREYFDGNSHGLDKAASIAADPFGSVFVTGQATIHDVLQTVTLKYRSDFYTELPQADSPAVAGLYYSNYGQIADTSGNPTDEVDYYTLHHYPQLYFGKGKMHMVWSAVDTSAGTPDTLHRIDVSFLGSGNPTKAMPLKEIKEAGYLNYYLAHCPQGITQVYGLGNLLFKKVWSGIDVVFSSNEAGMRIFFVCEPGSDPSNISLKFAGQDSLQLINGWDLQVSSLLGSYDFNRPAVYQLDSSGSVITLPWQLSWHIPQSDVGGFTGWGTYDLNQVLVIEISRYATGNSNACNKNLCWSTLYTGGAEDSFKRVEAGSDGNIYYVGSTSSASIPFIGLGAQTVAGGVLDAFCIKSNQTGSPSPQGNLLWVTFYGGSSSDNGEAIAINNQGGVYLCGTTLSSDFPYKQSSFFLGINSVYDQPYLNWGNNSIQPDAFVVRMAPAGNVTWANPIGGMYDEKGLSIVSNSDDFIYLVGYTGTDQSATFPFPLMHSLVANEYFQGQIGSDNRDGFIMKFDPFDKLVWSTYFGSNDEDYISDICLLASNSIAITGTTRSTAANIQTSPPYQMGTPGIDEFPIVSNQSLSEWVQTANGGESDAFVAVVDESNRLVFSTFFGGDGVENSEYAISLDRYPGGEGRIASNPQLTDELAISGTTANLDQFGYDFPSWNGGGAATFCQETYLGRSDIFFARFQKSNGVYSRAHASLFGGGGSEINGDLLLDENGDMIFTGYTSTNQYCGTPCTNEPTGVDPRFPSNASPTVNDYVQAAFSAGFSDGLFVRINQNNELDWATFFGGATSSNFHPARESVTGLAIGESNSNKYLYFAGYTDLLIGPTMPIINSAMLYNQSVAASVRLDAFMGRFELPYTVGIEEHTIAEDGLIIFPNPTTGLLTLEMKDFKPRPIDVFICNSIGQYVYLNENVMYQNEIQLSVSDLSPGLYSVGIRSQNTLRIVKFIKQ